MKEIEITKKLTKEEILQPIAEAIRELEDIASEYELADSEAAAAYQRSYEADIVHGFKLISEAEYEVAVTKESIESAEEAIQESLITGNKESQATAENVLKELEAELVDKEKRLRLLKEYRPKGDAALYAAYEAAHEEALAADKQISQAWAKIGVFIKEIGETLEYRGRTWGHNSYPNAYTVGGHSSEDLRKKSRGDYSLADAETMQRAKEEEYRKWVKARAETLERIPHHIEKEKNKDVIEYLRQNSSNQDVKDVLDQLQR